MGWFFRYFLPTLEKRHMSADVKVGKFYLIFQTIPRQLENQIKFAHLATPLSARQGVGKFYLIFQLTGDGLENQIKFAHLKRTVKPDGF